MVARYDFPCCFCCLESYLRAAVHLVRCLKGYGNGKCVPEMGCCCGFAVADAACEIQQLWVEGGAGIVVATGRGACRTWGGRPATRCGWPRAAGTYTSARSGASPRSSTRPSWARAASASWTSGAPLLHSCCTCVPRAEEDALRASCMSCIAAAIVLCTHWDHPLLFPESSLPRCGPLCIDCILQAVVERRVQRAAGGPQPWPHQVLH